MNKQEERAEFRGMLMMMLLAAAIIALGIASYALFTNRDIIAKDPLRYGMEVHDFQSCTCYDSKNIMWESAGTGFKSEQGSSIEFDTSLRLNLSELNRGVEGGSS